jgi:hypothetical protein
MGRGKKSIEFGRFIHFDKNLSAGRDKRLGFFGPWPMEMALVNGMNDSRNKNVFMTLAVASAVIITRNKGLRTLAIDHGDGFSSECLRCEGMLGQIFVLISPYGDSVLPRYLAHGMFVCHSP